MLRRLTRDELLSARVFALPEEVERRAAEILAAVRAEGEAAVRRYCRELDGYDPGEDWRVPEAEWDEALGRVPEEVRSALELAEARIRRYHEAVAPRTWELVPGAEGGVILGQARRPLSRVGVYVPAGSAPLLSTVLMCAVPARVAGVREILVATPAGRDGRVHPGILAACRVAGVTAVLRVGGVQALGALAFGTRGLPPVEKIVGPGNVYVVAAKRQLYGYVDIDLLPGPSEVVIVAEAGADPARLAADLLAQAEHDPLARAILLTPDESLAAAVAEEVGRQLPTLLRREVAAASLERGGGVVVVRDLDEAVQIAESLAPEHLQLAVRDPWRYLPRVPSAGAVFLGEGMPEVLGDYVAGPSHVLPTGGTARFFSPLGVETFLKRQSVMADAGVAAELLEAAAELAREEGLEAHARAARARLRIGGEG